ncbi:sugar dehydrogenase complex small subunit [Erwinia sp. E_sp_W01_6]|uniref:sugar dehydrogenase complex small subunit n=1 Tax=Erwinia sp. E_sp_W01_6 TaxID=3039408 RepID=UPI0030D0AF8E
MRNSNEPSSGNVQLSRRQVLLAGAVIMAGGVMTSVLPRFALADASEHFTPFMQLSRLLVNHQLDEAVGQRMLRLLAAQEKGLPDNLNQLIAIARAHNARIVEDFSRLFRRGNSRIWRTRSSLAGTPAALNLPALQKALPLSRR